MQPEHTDEYKHKYIRVPSNRPTEARTVPWALQYNPQLITSSAGPATVQADARAIHIRIKLKHSVQHRAVICEEQHAQGHSLSYVHAPSTGQTYANSGLQNKLETANLRKLTGRTSH
jgi:hypothetical protein